MTITVSPITRGQGHEFLKKLEAAGLTNTVAQKIIDSKGNDLAIRVVRFIKRGGFEPSTSQKHAHKIMGKNFFGVEEALHHFGVNLSNVQLRALAVVPYTSELLESVKDTHILIVVLPMSILDIQGKVLNKSNKFLNHNLWCSSEKFVRSRGENDWGWRLVRKTPMPESIGKDWDEQQQLLGTEEVVPTAQVMVYTIVGHYLATGERLFENSHVRCSNFNSSSEHISVGGFGADGLNTCPYRDRDRDPRLGLSVSSKP